MVEIVTYDNLPFNEREILRYAGIKDSTLEIKSIVELCKGEVSGLSYKVCYLELPLKECADGVIIGERKINSLALLKNLKGLKRALVVVASVGLEMDRLIARYSHLSPMHGLIMHAVGVERVESLMDHFVNEYKEPLRPRFSPGFGDFDIKNQEILLSLVNASKNVGVSLSDSFIMSPSKSVSAIIGIKE